MKKYRIIYQFKHSKMGFQNSITLLAQTLEEAMVDAKKQVSETYGAPLAIHFSFKPDPLECGTVVG